MSSSKGTLSNKNSWYKSLCSKVEHENKLKYYADKVAEGQKITVPLPKDKGGFHKNEKIKKFLNLLEDSKLERSKRSEKEKKVKQKTKESKND